MARKAEPGSSARIRWFVEGYALPWLKSRHPRGRARSVSGLARHAGLHQSTLYGWCERGRTPDREELLKLLRSVEVADAEAWAIWLTIGTGRPSSGPTPLHGQLPLPPIFVGEPATLDDRADPTRAVPQGVVRPAEPLSGAGAFTLVVIDGLQRAIAAARRGEDIVPLLEGMRRMAQEAKQLGLATGLAALLLAAPRRADAQDSTTRPGLEPGQMEPPLVPMEVLLALAELERLQELLEERLTAA